MTCEVPDGEDDLDSMRVWWKEAGEQALNGAVTAIRAAQDPKEATRERIARLKAAGELPDGAASRDLGAIPPVPRASGATPAPKPGRPALPEVPP